jgi:hypothetical protein
MDARSHAATHGYLYAGLAVASIWLAVVLTSVFAPALVTGSQHEHLHIAAFFNWLWGAGATGQVVVAYTELNRRNAPISRTLWLTLALGVSGAWLAVLLVSIFGPAFVTGSDPTILPLAAMISPIAGVIVTAFICRLAQAMPSPVPSPAMASSTPASQPATQVVEQIRQLAALRDAGMVSREEFEAKKTELLARM